MSIVIENTENYNKFMHYIEIALKWYIVPPIIGVVDVISKIIGRCDDENLF